MKIAPRSINGVYYKVTSRNYVSFGVGSSVDTLEDAIKTAKDSNDTAVKKGYEADQALVKAGDTDVLIALEKGMRLSEEFRFDLNPASLLIFDENGDSLNHAGNVV